MVHIVKFYSLENGTRSQKRVRLTVHRGEQGVVFGLRHLAKLVNVEVLVVGQGRVKLGVYVCVGPLPVPDHHFGPQEGERRDEAVHMAQPNLLQDFVDLG